MNINTIRLGFGATLLSAALSLNAQTLLGVYYGNQGWAMDEVIELESWQGKKHSVLNLFTAWTEKSQSLLFTYQLPNIWGNGNIPLITWEPFLSGDTPDDIEVQIASGIYDQYIEDWGNDLKQFLSGTDGVYGNTDDRRAYLRLAHEANGLWYPWSAIEGESTPADYIGMWRRIHDRFAELGIDDDHLQWIWTVSATDYGDFSAESYYPGSAYVDWVGMDGYNWGDSYSWTNWRSPEQVFEPMRLRLAALAPDKPVAIPEVGSSSNYGGSNNASLKDSWINELGEYIQTHDIRMMSWFNHDKETDWQVYGGSLGTIQSNGKNIYPAYLSTVQSETVLPTNLSNPRLINDQQFHGNFSGTSPQVSAKKECSINYQITQSWSGGYVAKVDVSANFAIPQEWVVDWTFAGDSELRRGWNALVEQSGNTITATAPSWWKWMPADRQPSIGFTGKGAVEYPVTASFNGVECAINQ